MIFLIILSLASAASLSSEDVMFLEKQRKLSRELKQLENKVVMDEKDREIFRYGTKVLMESSLVKINNYKNKKVVIEAEESLDLWGDCFFRIWKLDGIQAAQIARNLVINTPERRMLTFIADGVFAGKLSSIANVNKEICFSKIKK